MSYKKNKTRKHKQHHNNCNKDRNRNINVKKAIQSKTHMKTCRTKLYKSIYGSTSGGSIRSNKSLYN